MTADAAPAPPTKSVRRPPLGAAGEFVGRRVKNLQRGYLAEERAAVAALARLRRGVGKPPGDLADLWELTLADELARNWEHDSASPEETAAYTALTFYALHQQSRGEGMHRPGHGFGRALRGLVDAGASEGAVRRRFKAVGTADTPAELVHHTRGFITQFRAHSIPLDYAVFADQLVRVHNGGLARVRLAWGREFEYRRPDKPDPTPPAAENA